MLIKAYLPGTDATHAEHIETIKSRYYVGLGEDGKFLPGELGMGLVEGSMTCMTLMMMFNDTGLLLCNYYR